MPKRKEGQPGQEEFSIEQAIEEFGLDFSDRKKYADEFLEAYRALLQEDSPPLSKELVQSSAFQSHIRTRAFRGKIGPYTCALLRTLRDSDDLLKEGHEHLLGSFTNLDQSYFHLDYAADHNKVIRRYVVTGKGSEPLAKEQSMLVLKDILPEFQSANKILLEGLEDHSDPKWRQFCLAAFPHLCKVTGYTDRLDYFGLRYIQRARKLVAGVEQKDWGFLLDYLTITSDCNLQELPAAFDHKVRTGDLAEAKACVSFATRTYYSRKDQEDLLPFEKDLWVFVLRDFATGKLSLEDLTKTPDLWERLRTAYFSLPVQKQKSLICWLEGVQKEGGQTVLTTNTWNSIMVSPLLYSDTDIIIKAVDSGIQPSEMVMKILKKCPERLEPFAVFYNDLLWLLIEQGRDDFLLNLWTVNILNERIDTTMLPQVVLTIRKILTAENQMYTRQGVEKEKTVLQSEINDVCASPNIVDETETVCLLMENDLLPTRSLINFIMENGPKGLAKLRTLKEQTQSGNFDSSNSLQRDLEYPAYAKAALATGVGSGNFEEFETIPQIIERGRKAELTFEEKAEAEAAAFEAANFFRFIKERKDMGRKVAVIGNLRYGAYFVVEPLRGYLEDEKIPVSIFYVHSSGNSEKDLMRTVEAINNLVAEGKFEDVIIVDGSKDSFSYNTPRLPSALGFYAKRLSGKDGPQLAYWVPVPGDYILLGEEQRTFMPATDSKPQIILANTVIDPQHWTDPEQNLARHNPGYLDDPERFRSEAKEIVFTRSGVTILNAGRTEEDFLNLVQDHMIAVLPRYIQKAGSPDD